MDGLSVCRELRRRGDRTPVLMLTARDDIDDRVAGLDACADDYLVKPFALKDLLACLRALTRRAGEAPKSPIMQFADLSLGQAKQPTNEIVDGVAAPQRIRIDPVRFQAR